MRGLRKKYRSRAQPVPAGPAKTVPEQGVRIEKRQRQKIYSEGLSVNTAAQNLFLSMLIYNSEAEKVIQKLYPRQC